MSSSIHSKIFEVKEENIERICRCGKRYKFVDTFLGSVTREYALKIANFIMVLTHVEEIFMGIITKRIANSVITRTTLKFIKVPYSSYSDDLFQKIFKDSEIGIMYQEKNINYLGWIYSSLNYSSVVEPFCEHLFRYNGIDDLSRMVLSNYYEKIKGRLQKAIDITDVVYYLLTPGYYNWYPYTYSCIIENYFVKKGLPINYDYGYRKSMFQNSWNKNVSSLKYTENPFRYEEIVFDVDMVFGMFFIYLLYTKNFDFIINNEKGLFKENICISIMKDNFALQLFNDKTLCPEIKRILERNTDFAVKIRSLNLDEDYFFDTYEEMSNIDFSTCYDSQSMSFVGSFY